LIDDGWRTQFYAKPNVTPIFKQDSKTSRKMVAGGRRPDHFLDPAPILRVLANWLNLEVPPMRFDDIACETPFYLLLNTRDRPNIPGVSHQAG